MAVMRISALLAVLFCEVIGSSRPGDAAAVLSEAVVSACRRRHCLRPSRRRTSATNVRRHRTTIGSGATPTDDEQTPCGLRGPLRSRLPSRRSLCCSHAATASTQTRHGGRDEHDVVPQSGRSSGSGCEPELVLRGTAQRLGRRSDSDARASGRTQSRRGL
jgi:hypothetical protein